jgi:hypothetical protein
MPLSKARMRERKRLDRVKPKSNPDNVTPVKPNIEELRGLIKDIEENVKPKTENVKPKLSPPVYNPRLHKPGDRVLMRQGKRYIETVVPELDGSGQPIPDYL